MMEPHTKAAKAKTGSVFHIGEASREKHATCSAARLGDKNIGAKAAQQNYDCR